MWARYVIYTDEGKTFSPSGEETHKSQILGFVNEGKTCGEAIDILFDKNKRLEDYHKFDRREVGCYLLYPWELMGEFHCEKCGLNIVEGSYFCRHCGAKIEQN